MNKNMTKRETSEVDEAKVEKTLYELKDIYDHLQEVKRIAPDEETKAMLEDMICMVWSRIGKLQRYWSQKVVE